MLPITIEDLIQDRFRLYKTRSNDLNRAFKLSFEEFKELILGDCFYCGLPANEGLKFKYLDHTFRLNGIDRVDSDLGYIKSNCVACCSFCNFSKREIPLNAWLDWINRIAKRHHRETTAESLLDSIKQLRRDVNKTLSSVAYKKFQKASQGRVM
jgi:hypothetical protein